MDILAFLIVGLIAGWLAGQIVRGHGFGVVGDIIVGIVGAFIGGFLFRAFGVSPEYGLAGSIITALIGAVVLLAIMKMLRANP